MGNAVILAAHGRLAEGVKSGLDLVVGPMENLRTVTFVEGDTYEIIDQKLNDAVSSLDGATNLLFITDLMGGTPFNRAVMLFGNRPNVRVLSGLNFGLAYQALISEEEDVDAYAQEVLAAGHESIAVYVAPEEHENASEEDGI